MRATTNANRLAGSLASRVRVRPNRHNLPVPAIIVSGIPPAAFTLSAAALLSSRVSPLNSMEESTYERDRRDKLQKLRELGVEPFGGRTAGLAPLAQIKIQYKPEMGHDGGPVVKGA